MRKDEKKLTHTERIERAKLFSKLFVDKIHFRRNPKTNEIKAVFQFFDKTIQLSTGDFCESGDKYAISKRGKQVRSKIKDITSKIITSEGNPANLYTYFSLWKKGKEYRKKGRVIEKKASVSITFRNKGTLYFRYYFNGVQTIFNPRLGVCESDLMSSSEVRKEVTDILHHCRTIAEQKPTPEDFKDQVLTYVERMPIFV